MAKRKRTFGELKNGSYFWCVGIGSVHRMVVNMYKEPEVNPNMVSFGTSWFNLIHTYAKDTEYHGNSAHWFTDKNDAIKYAEGLISMEVVDAENHLNRLKEKIKDAEIRLDWLKERDNAFKEWFVNKS